MLRLLVSSVGTSHLFCFLFVIVIIIIIINNIFFFFFLLLVLQILILVPYYKDFPKPFFEQTVGVFGWRTRQSYGRHTLELEHSVWRTYGRALGIGISKVGNILFVKIIQVIYNILLFKVVCV